MAGWRKVPSPTSSGDGAQAGARLSATKAKEDAVEKRLRSRFGSTNSLSDLQQRSIDSAVKQRSRSMVRSMEAAQSSAKAKARYSDKAVSR